MADRTSADIFGRIFELLAKNPTAENKRLAREIFQLSNKYDFDPYQMYGDEACLALDLARHGVDPTYPEGGVVVLFLGEPGFDSASS